MDIAVETNTPTTVCIHVCLSSSTLDHAMAGVKMNSNHKKDSFGKRYMRVKKRSVEYVVCPLIFQKRETIVRRVEAVKEAMVTVEMVGFFRTKVLTRKSMRKEMVTMVKKSGRSSLFVNS